MKKLFTFFLFATLILSCCGCVQNKMPATEPTTPAATDPAATFPAFTFPFATHPTETTPPELTVSDPYTFSEITEVTLYQNSTTQTLPADDPRLIELFDFLSSAISEQEIVFMQGYTTKEGMAYTLSIEPRLEIKFRNDINEGLFVPAGYDELIVTGGRCTCVFYDDSFTSNLCFDMGKCAEEYSPYPEDFGSDTCPKLLQEFGFIAQ